MKIIQYIKKLSRSNAGLTKMNDIYITIASNINPVSIFGNPPVEIKFIDRETKKILELKFKHETNGEYRLSRLGPYVRDKNAKEGDNIYLEKIINDNNAINFIIDIDTNVNSTNKNPGWQKYEFDVPDEIGEIEIIEKRKDLIKSVLENVLKSHGYVLGSSVKGDVRFLTPKIKDIIPKTGKGNWSGKESFLFEFNYRMTYINLKFIISPGEEGNRKILTDIVKSLPNSKPAKGHQWLVFYSDSIKVDFLNEKFNNKAELEQIFEELLNRNKAQIEQFEAAIIKEQNNFTK